MSSSQENKTQRTREGNDEIRRSVEERQNTAKGYKHQLERIEQEDQKMHQRPKKSKTTREDTEDSARIQRHQKHIMHKNWKEKNAFPESEKTTKARQSHQEKAL